MNSFQNIRNKKVLDIIRVLKTIYIMFCIVGITNIGKYEMNKTNAVFSVIILSIVGIFIIGYFSWILYYSKMYMGISSKKIEVIELIILLFLYILIITITEKDDSQYKLASIFVVIIGAIQFGRNYSIKVASVYSITTLVLDFLINPKTRFMLYYKSSEVVSIEQKETITLLFQEDIMLISVLFVIAFVLGLYVDIENEHSKQLRELANIDELTGLYNHRYFQENIAKLMIEANDNKEEVSLLFMDIDYFKNFNDINGHQLGDEVLRQIGDILKICVRKNDIVARYGGEEFAAILPNTKEEYAIKIGERIRELVQNTYFKGQENQPNKNITISIGVSSYPRRASNKHQFINTADDALYRAKAFNKNRVESYHSVLDGISKTMDIKDETVKSLKTFISMINIKDRYTYGHTERVVIYTKWFAEYLNLREEEKLQLQMSAYLHDIGKVEISEEVLNKKGRLTNKECQMFREHPQVGVDLIKNISQFEPFTPFIKHHHERYDGRGYPDGLKGEEIPYLARIMTIADSFDAMTSNRPYNVRKTHKQGIQELREHAGTQFDPILVEQFIKMLDKYKDNL